MTPDGLDPDAADLLEAACGFVLEGFPGALEMLPESDDLESIATDGLGGAFYLWHAQAVGGRVPVVYLSSNGKASRFADDFEGAVTIVAALPYSWYGLLGAAHGGDEVMAGSVRRCEDQIEPESAEALDELRDLLGLDLSGAAARLVAAVRAEPAFVPLLDCGDGIRPARSFAERTAPR